MGDDLEDLFEVVLVGGFGLTLGCVVDRWRLTKCVFGQYLGFWWFFFS